MTNRVEALFLCRELVLMRLNGSEGRREVLFRSVPKTLLPTPSVTFIWHYSVVGVTVTFGITGARVPCFHERAPCFPVECKLQQQGKVQLARERGASLRCAHSI